jgi:hypothetical protein
MASLTELVKEIERKRARGEVTDVDEETFNAMDAAQGLSDIEDRFKKPRDKNLPRKTPQERMKEAMSGLNNMKKGGSVKSSTSLKKTAMW